jgi:hypothetical protein
MQTQGVDGDMSATEGQMLLIEDSESENGFLRVEPNLLFVSFPCVFVFVVMMTHNFEFCSSRRHPTSLRSWWGRDNPPGNATRMLPRQPLYLSRTNMYAGTMPLPPTLRT